MSDSIAMQNYLESVAVMDSYTDRIDGYNFYRFIFPNNEMSGVKEQDFSKPNAIFLYENDIPGAKKEYSKRIMLNDTWEDDYMSLVEQKEHTLCSGMAFRGNRTLQANEQNINALIFDLDGVGIHQIKNLLHRFTLQPDMIRSLPMPTFLVVSGGGVHLYYVFDEPIALFPNVRKQLKDMKYDLTYKIWDWKSTSQFKKIQYQRIGQPFRMVGSINEKHGNEIVAYQLNDRVSIDYLNKYVMEPIHQVDIEKRYSSRMTMEEAEKKYPDWTAEVKKGTYKRKKWDIAGKTHGSDPWALYHWWLRQSDKVVGGHRYFFMMFCVVYANKCDVPKEVVEKDLWEVYEKIKGVEHENQLEEKDVWSALKIYKKDIYNYTIDDIKKLTEIPIEKNKRNRRSQKEHLERARAVQNVDYPNGSWRNKDGRPKGSKNKNNPREQLVREYMEKHPEANVTEIARALQMSRPTVYKYLPKEEKMENIKVDYIVTDSDGKEILIETEEKNENTQQERLKKYLELMGKEGEEKNEH